MKAPQFGLDYFRRFDIVLNGLDNVEARRHVNRLCLAAEVPLIESGTTGHLGQVSLLTLAAAFYCPFVLCHLELSLSRSKGLKCREHHFRMSSCTAHPPGDGAPAHQGRGGQAGEGNRVL